MGDHAALIDLGTDLQREQPAPLRSRASDERLAQAVARGREEAFAEIYRRHHQALYRYCHSILRNSEDAQDALQNAMANAYAALSARRREIAVRPWLFRIAHNEAITLLRRQRTRARHAAALQAQTATFAEHAPEQTLQQRERMEVLLADLATLAQRQRGALLMRELGGLSIEEIAAALSTTPSTAKQSLFEARRALRELAEGRTMECESVQRLLDENDGRVLRSRRVRSHMRSCSRCRELERQAAQANVDLQALAPPLPAAAAAAILTRLMSGSVSVHGAVGGAVAGGSAGAAAAGMGSTSGATLATVGTTGSAGAGSGLAAAVGASAATKAAVGAVVAALVVVGATHAISSPPRRSTLTHSRSSRGLRAPARQRAAPAVHAAATTPAPRLLSGASHAGTAAGFSRTESIQAATSHAHGGDLRSLAGQAGTGHAKGRAAPKRAGNPTHGRAQPIGRTEAPGHSPVHGKQRRTRGQSSGQAHGNGGHGKQSGSANAKHKPAGAAGAASDQGHKGEAEVAPGHGKHAQASSSEAAAATSTSATASLSTHGR